MLHHTVNQGPHWTCQQYGHSGGTWGWLGVKRCQPCLQNTSHRLDDTAFVGTFSWQDPVHFWKAGPGKVMTVVNVLLIYYPSLFHVNQCALVGLVVAVVFHDG